MCILILGTNLSWNLNSQQTMTKILVNFKGVGDQLILIFISRLRRRGQVSPKPKIWSLDTLNWMRFSSPSYLLLLNAHVFENLRGSTLFLSTQFVFLEFK